MRDPNEALGSVSLPLEIGLCRQESSCEETKKNIVAQRIALYACQKEFEDSCLDFVKLDETWVDTFYIVKKC